MTNCPNCGAPIRGFKCEYCDTVFSTEYEYRIHMDEIARLVNQQRTAELYQSAVQAMSHYARIHI